MGAEIMANDEPWGIAEERCAFERKRGEALLRPRVDAMDAILGDRFRVLDDGFVRVVDYMGDDAAIVQAARVSYGVGTRRTRDDRGLIRYLIRNMHTTPFEMCELKLHVRAPMDVWRQWIRHRTASVNEYSTRYSVAIDGAHRTTADKWRLQSHDNQQGSLGTLPREAGERLSAAEKELLDRSRAVYVERLAAGVAREQARKDLPLSTYTEAYWKIDLHNLLHFLLLRMDMRAQEEIRAYANIIGEQIVQRWTPIAWEAFIDYRKNALHLSGVEVEIASALARDDVVGATRVATEHGLVKQAQDGTVGPIREGHELVAKLIRLGLAVPWHSS
jgi:thymidylate synthase (FAD)